MMDNYKNVLHILLWILIENGKFYKRVIIVSALYDLLDIFNIKMNIS